MPARTKDKTVMDDFSGTPEFSFSGTGFLLDNKPFQILSGEMHPARILKEHWRHRIQMVKTMGCSGSN